MVAIDLNDDEMIKAKEAADIVNERLFYRSFDPTDITTAIHMKNFVIETFEKVANLKVLFDMTLGPDGRYHPDIQIIGRTGTIGEAIDKSLETETDWERKQYDANKNTIEEIVEKTDGYAEVLID